LTIIFKKNRGFTVNNSNELISEREDEISPLGTTLTYNGILPILSSESRDGK
jgi:hypothetical protein